MKIVRVVAAVVERFAAAQGQVEEDVAEFLEQLVHLGAIRRP